MIDKEGLNDACYVPLSLPGTGAVSIGLAATYEAGKSPAQDDGTRAMQQRNPQLARPQGDGGLRVYHPSRSLVTDERHVILFDRWVRWAGAEKVQLVLRLDTRRESRTLLARPDEKGTFSFDDPEEGKLKYINLDFFTNRDDFPAVYILLGHPAARRILRIGAGLDGGNPVITANLVAPAQAPQQLFRG